MIQGVKKFSELQPLTPNGTERLPAIQNVGGVFVNGYIDLSDLSDLTNPITQIKDGDNDFIVMASIIARANGTFSNGAPMDWTILNTSDNHNSSFFKSVIPNATSKRLEIHYPEVKSILSFIITPDEVISGYGITMAASVGTKYADITTSINHSGYAFLLGDGTTTWSKQGGTKNQVTAGTFSTTDGYTFVTFGPSFSHTENQSISVVYGGANNYHIQRSFSGVSGNDQIKFRMIDNATGMPVTTAPTASDYIFITGVGKYRSKLNMSEYSTIALSNTSMFEGNNFWCIGMFELWMKAIPSSNSSMLIKWQENPSATSYKLYRDTLEDFSTKVLIYSGSSLNFHDTGLSSLTKYYYQLCNESDVEISQFSNRTNQ